jgi:hypothetical protein
MAQGEPDDPVANVNCTASWMVALTFRVGATVFVLVAVVDPNKVVAPSSP